MREYNIAMIGAGGHVGLPLSLVLVDAGFSVIGIEKDVEKVQVLTSGCMPFDEAGAKELLKKYVADTNRLRFTTDVTLVQYASYIILVPGTPISDDRIPDKTQLKSAIEDILPHLKRDQVLILRSTVAPGTTEEIRALLQKRLKKDVFASLEIVFAPERILEGRAIEELRKLPQIIGAFTDKGYEKTDALFTKLGVESIRLTPIEAEISKLLANNYRYVNFALANEFLYLCQSVGANFERIRLATNYEYPRSRIPKSGFTRGPCLGKDSWLLLGSDARMIALSGIISSAYRINEALPELTIKTAKNALGSLVGCKILVLGLSFKRNSDDVRDSLAQKLVSILRGNFGSDVIVHDPFVLPGDLKELCRNVDAIFVATNHSDYDDSSFLKHAKSGCIVIDPWFHLAPDLGMVFTVEEFSEV